MEKNGAVEKTRTSKGRPATTSRWCVYQFRHDRTCNMTFHKNGDRDVTKIIFLASFIMPINKLEWKVSKGLTPYLDCITRMEQRVEDIIAGNTPEMVWLVEHPPLYTAGTSANEADLLSNRFPLYHTGRGGQITYHGPGQRVAYVMLNLKKRDAMDVRAFVQQLEEWLIATLGEFGVQGEIREGRVGVWVNNETTEAKIAALGIRVRKWVTFHGVSLNVNPDLSHYAGIVPCGIRGFGVTSLHTLNKPVSMEEVDAVLEKKFKEIFDGQ